MQELSRNLTPRIVLGLAFVAVGTRSFGGRRRRRRSEPVTAAGDTIRLPAVFATRRLRVTSRAFRGGEVVAILGGGEVDLTEARLAGKAVLDVLALWGGVDVRVPPGWRVSLEVTAVMGGVEDTRDAAEIAAAEPAGDALGGERTRDGERPHLVVQGFTMMGGVDVRG